MKLKNELITSLLDVIEEQDTTIEKQQELIEMYEYVTDELEGDMDSMLENKEVDELVDIREGEVPLTDAVRSLVFHLQTDRTVYESYRDVLADTIEDELEISRGDAVYTAKAFFDKFIEDVTTVREAEEYIVGEVEKERVKKIRYELELKEEFEKKKKELSEANRNEFFKSSFYGNFNTDSTL